MPIYFYKVTDPYGCFSNFSRHAIELDGYIWPTVEHYYQAYKFHETERDYLMPLIRMADTPEIAAAIGRKPENVAHPNWDKLKLEVMSRAIRKKVFTHASIRDILISTHPHELVEDSPVDYFWGCGADGTGANHLGRLLVAIRNETISSR